MRDEINSAHLLLSHVNEVKLLGKNITTMNKSIKHLSKFAIEADPSGRAVYDIAGLNSAGSMDVSLVCRVGRGRSLIQGSLTECVCLIVCV
jgi:hypothetical protein